MFFNIPFINRKNTDSRDVTLEIKEFEWPSENEVLEKGYDMVEMDGLLLKKIEELTLYTIELNKLIAEQQKIIENLQSK